MYEETEMFIVKLREDWNCSSFLSNNTRKIYFFEQEKLSCEQLDE